MPWPYEKLCPSESQAREEFVAVLASEPSDALADKEFFQQLLRESDSSPDPFYNLGLLEDNGIAEEDYFNWLSRGKGSLETGR